MRQQDLKTIKKNCDYCGELFLVSVTHVYQKYCSWRCRNRMFKKLNPEKVKESKRLERIRHAERYRLLNDIYKDKIRFGGNKRRVMERDKFSCVNCKKKYPYVNLVVHHVNGNKTDNILNNLKTLCRACHASIHHKHKNPPYLIV